MLCLAAVMAEKDEDHNGVISGGQKLVLCSRFIRVHRMHSNSEESFSSLSSRFTKGQ